VVLHLSLSPHLVPEAVSMDLWGAARPAWGMLLVAVAHVDDRSHDVHDCGEQP
jgi:hypothetical protein